MKEYNMNQPSTELINSLKVCLATNFVLYLKAHGFHWNVCGKDFYQLHKLFKLIYVDVYNSIDVMAEEIRALDAYAPASLEKYIKMSEIADENNIPTDENMVTKLLYDNKTMIDTLNICFKLAQAENYQGLCNFLADRIDKHNKHCWMLKSTLK